MTTTEDVVQVDGQVSLREAILAANQNAVVADAPAGAPGLDEVTFASTEVVGINLIIGPLAVSDDVHIQGPSAGFLILDTSHRFEHFQVTNSLLRLERTVLQNSFRAMTLADQAGGGSIYARNSSLDLRDVEFVHSISTGNGGAVYLDAGSLSLRTTTFTQCSGRAGGAVFLGTTSGEAPLLEDSEFNFNQANEKGGAVYLGVAGISGTISGCRFTNNSADVGGAVYVDDHFSSDYSVQFAESDFRDNLARRRGGAVAAEDTRLIVHSCLFAENRAADPLQANRGDGGAIYLRGGARSQLSASRFLANEAERNGGAVFIDQNKEVGSHSSVFAGNRAGGEAAMNGGGAVFNYRGTFRTFATKYTGNSAFSTQGAGGAVFSWAGTLVSSDEFELNWATRSGGALEVVDGDLRLWANFGNAQLPARGNFVRTVPTGSSGLHKGGALSVTSLNGTATALLGSCSFFDNSADVGGALYVGSMSEVNFRWNASTLGRNTALRHGGAIFLASASSLLNPANAIFFGNAPEDTFQE